MGKAFGNVISLMEYLTDISEVRLPSKGMTPQGMTPKGMTPKRDYPKRDDKFSKKIYAEVYIRPNKMATLKEKSYNYSIIIGKNPHLRSLTVDEFSKKIHAETQIRPNMMAALNVKMRST